MKKSAIKTSQKPSNRDTFFLFLFFPFYLITTVIFVIWIEADALLCAGTAGSYLWTVRCFYRDGQSWFFSLGTTCLLDMLILIVLYLIKLKVPSSLKKAVEYLMFCYLILARLFFIFIVLNLPRSYLP